MHRTLFSLTHRIHLPKICALCNQFHQEKLAICSYCLGCIRPLETQCIQCAYPLPDAAYLRCGQCIKNPPHFDRAFIAYPFTEPLRTLVHQFKYHNALYLQSLLSYLMLQAITREKHQAQCLIPVPMHSKRLKARGFNQAAILTRSLAKKLAIPYDLRSCQKIINTVPQALLDKEQRQKNIHKTFNCAPIPYEHVLIIDDLLTTGSTANELALTLKEAGVKQVGVWCCARAIQD